MEKKERICNEKNNLAIISLIRKKVAPLQNGKRSTFKYEKKQSQSLHSSKVDDQALPVLPSAKIYYSNSDKENRQSSILDKVRDFIDLKRRENHVPQPKNELEQYIKIFERPVSQKERMKRQSIEFRVIEYQKKQNPSQNKSMVGFIEEQIDLTQNHRSILNAKIRRKLNHKKLIQINRRNA